MNRNQMTRQTPAPAPVDVPTKYIFYALAFTVVAWAGYRYGDLFMNDDEDHVESRRFPGHDPIPRSSPIETTNPEQTYLKILEEATEAAHKANAGGTDPIPVAFDIAIKAGFKKSEAVRIAINVFCDGKTQPDTQHAAAAQAAGKATLCAVRLHEPAEHPFYIVAAAIDEVHKFGVPINQAENAVTGAVRHLRLDLTPPLESESAIGEPVCILLIKNNPNYDKLFVFEDRIILKVKPDPGDKETILRTQYEASLTKPLLHDTTNRLKKELDAYEQEPLKKNPRNVNLLAPYPTSTLYNRTHHTFLFMDNHALQTLKLNETVDDFGKKIKLLRSHLLKNYYYDLKLTPMIRSYIYLPHWFNKESQFDYKVMRLYTKPQGDEQIRVEFLADTGNPFISLSAAEAKELVKIKVLNSVIKERGSQIVYKGIDAGYTFMFTPYEDTIMQKIGCSEIKADGFLQRIIDGNIPSIGGSSITKKTLSRRHRHQRSTSSLSSHGR